MCYIFITLKIEFVIFGIIYLYFNLMEFNNFKSLLLFMNT